MIMGTPGALFGWSCLDDDVDMAAPVFDLYCSGTIVNVNDSSVLMSRIDLRGRQLSTAALRAVLPRGGVDVDAVMPKVRPIVDAIVERGAVAALEYGETFDRVRPQTVRVPAARLAEALADLDPAVRVALEVAIERTRAVHADQRRTDTTTTLAPGATVTERWVPVERVGLYVPGGNAVYPSSVVMNVVPAQVAGNSYQGSEPANSSPYPRPIG